MSLENYQTSQPLGSSSEYHVSTWADIQFKLSDHIEYKLYPVLNYNHSLDSYKMSFNRHYLSFFWKNLYLSLGRQWILWGFGRIYNPTNYFLDLKSFEKNNKQTLLSKGSDILLVDYSLLSHSIEFIIVRQQNSYPVATRYKTFLGPLDLSFSLFSDIDNKLHYGFGLETTFKNSFVTYTDFSYLEQHDWETVFGLEYVLPFFSRSFVNFEYFYDKDPSLLSEELALQYVYSPYPDLSFILGYTYDINRYRDSFFNQISFNIKKFEFIISYLDFIDHKSIPLNTSFIEKSLTLKMLWRY